MLKIIVIYGLLTVSSASDFKIQYDDKPENAHFATPPWDHNSFMTYMKGLMLVPKIGNKDDFNFDSIGGFEQDVKPVVEPNTEPPPPKGIFGTLFTIPPPVTMQGNNTRANFQESVEAIMKNTLGQNQFEMFLNDLKKQPNFSSTGYGVPTTQPAPTQATNQQVGGPFVPSSILIQGHTMQTQPIQYQFVLANGQNPSSFSSTGSGSSASISSPGASFTSSGESSPTLPSFSNIGVDPKFQLYHPPTTAEVIKDQIYYDDVINKLKQYDFDANKHHQFEEQIAKPLPSGFGAGSFGDFPMIDNPYKSKLQEHSFEETKIPFSLEDMKLQHPLKFGSIPKLEEPKYKIIKHDSYSGENFHKPHHHHHHHVIKHHSANQHHKPKHHELKLHEPKHHELKFHEPKHHEFKHHELKHHEPKHHELILHQPIHHELKLHHPKHHEPKHHELKHYEPKHYDSTHYELKHHVPKHHEPKHHSSKPKQQHYHHHIYETPKHSTENYDDRPKSYSHLNLDFNKSAFEPKFEELHSYEDASGEKSKFTSEEHKFNPNQHKFTSEDNSYIKSKQPERYKEYKPQHYEDFNGFGSQEFSEVKPYKFNSDDGKHNKYELKPSSSNIKNTYTKGGDDVFKPKIVKPIKPVRTTPKPKFKKPKPQAQQYVVKIVKRV